MPFKPFLIMASGAAALSALLVLWFLIRRPALGMATKLVLLLAIGVLPLLTAGIGNIAGFEATKARVFCASCHVMTPYGDDSDNRASKTLAARHAHNDLIGDENCYACHADYGMYGTVLTKMGGMRHVWLYYTEFRDMPLAEARDKIHLRKPYPNQNCMQCHSTELQGWLATPDHRASLQDVRDGRVSCASAGCHGVAHPTTKPDAAVPAQFMIAREAGLPSDAGAPPVGGENR